MNVDAVIDFIHGPLVVVGSALAIVAASALVGVFVGRFIRVGMGRRRG